MDQPPSTMRRTVDHHTTPLGATAAFYRQGNQRRATLPRQQPTPSTAARIWPRPCWWSPPWLVPTPTRSHPSPPLMRRSPWARTPAPRASWAWGRASCSATRARASVMRSNRRRAWLASHTTWKLSCAWSRPALLISPPSVQHLAPSLLSTPSQPSSPLLLSLCPPRSPPLSPSSGPPARKAPAGRLGRGQVEDGVMQGQGAPGSSSWRSWTIMKHITSTVRDSELSRDAGRRWKDWSLTMKKSYKSAKE